MRALVLLLPLMMFTIPVAEAGNWSIGRCGFPLSYCLREHNVSNGDCETGGWEYHSTSFWTEPFPSQWVTINGYSTCWSNAGGSHSSHGIYVDYYVGPWRGNTQWTESETNGVPTCRMGPFADCPLGPPPTVPWGRLLP